MEPFFAIAWISLVAQAKKSAESSLSHAIFQFIGLSNNPVYVLPNVDQGWRCLIQTPIETKPNRLVWAHCYCCLETKLFCKRTKSICLDSPILKHGNKADSFGRVARTAWEQSFNVWKQKHLVWTHRLQGMGINRFWDQRNPSCFGKEVKVSRVQ